MMGGGTGAMRTSRLVYVSGCGSLYRMGTGGDDCSTGFSNIVVHHVPNRRSDTRTLREILPQFTELITKGGRIA